MYEIRRWKSTYSKCGKSKNEQQEIKEIAEEHVGVHVRLFFAVRTEDFFEEVLHRFLVFFNTGNKLHRSSQSYENNQTKRARMLTSYSWLC